MGMLRNTGWGFFRLPGEAALDAEVQEAIKQAVEQPRPAVLYGAGPGGPLTPAQREHLRTVAEQFPSPGQRAEFDDFKRRVDELHTDQQRLTEIAARIAEITGSERQRDG